MGLETITSTENPPRKKLFGKLPEEVRQVEELAEKIRKVGELVMGPYFRSRPSPLIEEDYIIPYSC